MNTDLTQIPGIGNKMAQHLIAIGYSNIASLKGQDPEEIYTKHCLLQGPGNMSCKCVLYCYRLAVFYANCHPINKTGETGRIEDFMLWNDLFGKENEPSNKQISEFVATPLWSDLADYVQQTYNIQPKIEYSSCAMDGGIWKGWNVKYKKSDKSLCTLYPKQGFFLSLITVSEKDAAEADLLIPLCSDYVQDLYNRTQFGKNYGKMLGIEVTNDEILRDMKELIALRVSVPKKNL